MTTSDLAITQLRVAMMSCSSGHVTVIICQHLLLSGDVELNPGPLDQGRLFKEITHHTYIHTRTDE